MDNENYRNFYKYYEGKDRMTSIKLKDEHNSIVFVVTPRYINSK